MEIMTPEATAFHLIFEFQRDIIGDKKKARECALKVVRHIISANPHSNMLNSEFHSAMEFWYKVKEEIEKL
jgi:hypothetical protein